MAFAIGMQASGEAVCLEEVFPELSKDVSQHRVHCYEYPQSAVLDLGSNPKEFDLQKWIASLKRFSAESKRGEPVVYIETLPDGVVFVRVKGRKWKVAMEEIWRFRPGDITEIRYRCPRNASVPEPKIVLRMTIWKLDGEAGASPEIYEPKDSWKVDEPLTLRPVER